MYKWYIIMITIVLVIMIITMTVVTVRIIRNQNANANAIPNGTANPNVCTNKPVDNKIEAFTEYLKEKMSRALLLNINDSTQLSDIKTGWGPANQFGMGIYVKNTPGGRGPVKVWSTFCGEEGIRASACKWSDDEPKFYFGSGTKPITATMVAGQLYKTWRHKNPNSDPKEFIDWYSGKSGERGNNAASYSDIFKMTNGFDGSNFVETVSRASNTQSPDTSKLNLTQNIRDWLYCCSTSDLVTECPANTSMFCHNTCSSLCPEPLDKSFTSTDSSGKCLSPYCPDSICRWALRDKDNKLLKVDPNSVPITSGKVKCYCPIIPPTDFQRIFENLSVYNVAMMRSGIPDSDSIWGLDTVAQNASRTSSIGPIQFASEILGFDWNPLWKSGVPVTKSAILDNGSLKSSNRPAAQYSSSAYTFLGILLWLLTKSPPNTTWSDIDLNSLLPNHLQHLINFAGTIGNGGEQYFKTDEYGNKYYSYELTVNKGGVVQAPPTEGTPIGPTQTGLEKRGTTLKVAPTSVQPIRQYNGKFKKDIFVDWDSSSGMLCGNGWGTASDMAEIYMNIFSPTADHPIMGKEIQRHYVDAFLRYNGPNAQELYQNQLQPPLCLGVQAWSQGGTYNCGSMGPDWFGLTDFNSYTSYGTLPVYGHLGDTYGYCSCHIYFPPGKLTAWEPLKNSTDYYFTTNTAGEYVPDPNWNLTFEFSGGMEFTMSCAQNSCISESQGPIQQFIWEVIKDPFKW